jgi:hypothetical protein
MPKNLKIFLLIPVFLVGCAVYHPQAPDIPLIDHKGEVRIDLGGTFIPSFHSSFSYGLTKKIALQIYGSAGLENRRYFQFASGLYKSLKDKKVIEIYSGIGFGHANSRKDPLANLPETIEQSLHGNYQIYFVQFNWGKNNAESNKLEWAIGIKSGLFHSIFKDVNYYGIYPEGSTYLTYTENHILLEPVISFRIGDEKARFTFKIGALKFLYLENTDHFIPAPMLTLSLGVNLKLN